ITGGDDATSLESHWRQLVIHGSNPIGMTNLNFAARELSSGGSTVEKLTVSGHSHLGCGVGGHPACRQVRESDRQDAYLPHSQDGCAPSSAALFNKANRLPAALSKNKRGWKPRLLYRGNCHPYEDRKLYARRRQAL